MKTHDGVHFKNLHNQTPSNFVPGPSCTSYDTFIELCIGTIEALSLLKSGYKKLLLVLRISSFMHKLIDYAQNCITEILMGSSQITFWPILMKMLYSISNAFGLFFPTGIVSSISFSPQNGMLAVGSYSQTTAVYAESNMEPLYVLHGQLGGVTQVS
jgi:WD40 repeat protein